MLAGMSGLVLGLPLLGLGAEWSRFRGADGSGGDLAGLKRHLVCVDRGTGKGDMTAKALLWESENASCVPLPVLPGGRLDAASDAGLMR